MEGYAEAAGAACPLPGTFQPATLGETWAVLVRMKGSFWAKALAYALGAAVLIGVPTVIIPNPIFAREVATTPADYVIFVISTILIGVTWAVPNPGRAPETENRSLWGAFGTFLAVGCPTCNKIILVLLGSSGALTYFAPVQPLLGVGAIAFIVAALRRRVGLLLPPKPPTAFS